MFDRARQVRAVREQIELRLSHKAWKPFSEKWNAYQVGKFIDRWNNPRNKFEAPEKFEVDVATRFFLLELLADLSGKMTWSQRYHDAAEKLADILHHPRPVAKPYQLNPNSPGGTSEGFSGAKPDSSGSKSYSPPPPPPDSEPESSIPPDADEDDARRLASLEALIAHPNTSPQERAAALAAYTRIRLRMKR